jgi:cell division septation protein DedD
VADLSHDSADDAFHEIQLSGKQLVFLFMATTVISVVIFLCGVLVGRGVRAEDIGVDSTLAAAPAPVPAAQTDPVPVTADAPTPPADAPLTYAERLDTEKPPAEVLRPGAGSRKPADEPRRPERPARSASTSAPQPERPAPPPAVQGAKPGTWAVQVVSLRDRSAASQLVQRLRGKSYPAFLVSPAAGAPAQLYKVQIGRYGDRGEAERIAARLKKEEQFDPFIVR